MDELGSFKTLEEVRLKATYNMEANGKSIEEGETIALFDSIQISGLKEYKDFVSAKGGYQNPSLVFWETTKEVQFNFSQGVFSKEQFGLLNNAKVFTTDIGEPILITVTEKLESDEYGNIRTKYIPYDQIFVYNAETGEKLISRTWENGLRIGQFYTDVIVTYRYNYNGGAQIVKIGQQFLRGFLELEAKTRVKDDSSGLITTGIIRIPKLKLMSGLSIRLGAQASPVVGNFSAVGVPTGSRGNSYVAEFDFLNNDIDSDI